MTSPLSPHPDAPSRAASDDPPFAWTADEIRRVGYRAIDLVAAHLTDLPGEPTFRPVPQALADAFRAEAPPAAGEGPDAVLDRFARDVAPYPFGNGHPRFFGWVNSPPAVMGVVGAALAAAMNPSVAGGNHAAVWVERQVTEWMKALLGFPADGMGLLVSGGSAAAITALAVARHRACARRGWDVRAEGLPLVVDGRPRHLLVYKSAEGHGCNQKAAELLGLGRANVREVPVDAALRMRPDALDAMLGADAAAGHAPVAVVASAGTVNTGAVDPLAAIADVCARRGVWLHVDGAYGAPAALLAGPSAPDGLPAEDCAALAALGRADSVAVDAHKWLYVPVDAGLVLVRDAGAMRDAFSLVPPYLRTDGNAHGVQGPPWLAEYGAEQTRPFRGLKVWMAMRHLGMEGYRALVARDVALARHWAARVRAEPEMELWEPQGLSIVCFRAAPEALDGPAVDALNRRVLRDVQLGGAGFLSSTVLGGRFWLRACVVNPRATAADVDAVLDAVLAAVRTAAGDARQDAATGVPQTDSGTAPSGGAGAGH
ncbi:amino acid decarboxylase [Gemmatimonadetes bacterium T265]|nr:amino acid decarboxylase [Gemmatimonadetes bacterium T265]